mmetsp:Transcript_38138/g.122439  ORF Transcript_38138/g.122439 Transcript_38138/m.122439 type:complete len:251 (+) Transcript_38138:148-900(+)
MRALRDERRRPCGAGLAEGGARRGEAQARRGPGGTASGGQSCEGRRQVCVAEDGRLGRAEEDRRGLFPRRRSSRRTRAGHRRRGRESRRGDPQGERAARHSSLPTAAPASAAPALRRREEARAPLDLFARTPPPHRAAVRRLLDGNPHRRRRPDGDGLGLRRGVESPLRRRLGGRPRDEELPLESQQRHPSRRYQRPEGPAAPRRPERGPDAEPPRTPGTKGPRGPRRTPRGEPRVFFDDDDDDDDAVFQ